MKKINKKGFTMAELLIVVAIIAVLVAIAIPVFTSQLEKSKQATNEANIRAAYAEAQTALLLESTQGDAVYTAPSGTSGATVVVSNITLKKTTKGLGEYDNVNWPDGKVPSGTISADKATYKITFAYTTDKQLNTVTVGE